MEEHGHDEVLIVDDTLSALALLSDLLAEAGYDVRQAQDGEMALLTAGVRPPGLILLDIHMPGMDGFEVCRRLKAQPDTRDIPVLFISAAHEEQDKIRGFAHGAVDYITKPYLAGEVLARVNTHLALRKAQAALAHQNQRLRQERELIEDVILRMRRVRRFDPRHLRYLMSSPERTDGDVLLSAFRPDGGQWVLVGDISGHGPTAAICAPLVAQVFYGALESGRSIEGMQEELEAVMCEQLPVNVFMPAVVVEVAADRRRLRVWNRGLPGCLVINGGKVRQRLEADFCPFGVNGRDEIVGRETVVTTAPGDRLYVFTDGLTETASRDGELFSEERAENLLAGLAEGQPLESLYAVLEAFRGAAQAADDLTLVELLP